MGHTTAVEVSYQREVLSAHWDELMPLFRKHYRELSANLDIPLEIDYAGYALAEKNDAIRMYVARNKFSEIIGYCVYFIRQNMHYASSLQAVQDVLFVLPEYRGTGIGCDLVNFCDDELRKEGVQLVHQHSKLAHPALGNMLAKRCGYVATEIIYTKRLDK